MDEQQVRQIIRDELSWLIKNERLVIGKAAQILDGNDIVIGGTNGTRIGTSATQKLGFFGKAAEVQPGAVASPSGGLTVDGPARTAIDQIRSNLIQLGLQAT